jgi:hypothetical protein
LNKLIYHLNPSTLYFLPLITIGSDPTYIIYAFAEKFINGNTMDRIKDVFGMTELGRLLKEEVMI